MGWGNTSTQRRRRKIKEYEEDKGDGHE